MNAFRIGGLLCSTGPMLGSTHARKKRFTGSLGTRLGRESMLELLPPNAIEMLEKLYSGPSRCSPNSLIRGNLQGIARGKQGRSGSGRASTCGGSNSYTKIPYAIEQGISPVDQGNWKHLAASPCAAEKLRKA